MSPARVSLAAGPLRTPGSPSCSATTTRCPAPWPSPSSRLDEPGSTIARTFGFLTGAFAWIVHRLSGGHRKGTHSLLGVGLMTIAALWAGSFQQGAAANSQHQELWWHLVPAGLILALLFSAGLRAPPPRPYR